MKYSLCIEPIFTEMEFCDRIRAAKACGVDAVEFWEPETKDVGEIARVCAQEKISVAAMSVARSWDVRLNDDRQAVLQKLRRSIELGRELGCNTFIGLSGDAVGRRESQSMLLVENLKAAAELLEKEGARLVIEPLNSHRDHKGYFLDSAREAFCIVKSVNSPAVQVLYDCYHMQIMEGNVIETCLDNLNWIGHFHSASVPGRNEPYRGELYYPALIRALDKAGYGGFFGMEFWPSCPGEEESRAVMESLAYFKTGVIPQPMACEEE